MSRQLDHALQSCGHGVRWIVAITGGASRGELKSSAKLHAGVVSAAVFEGLVFPTAGKGRMHLIAPTILASFSCVSPRVPDDPVAASPR